jgi:hypothetical protein
MPFTAGSLHALLCAGRGCRGPTTATVSTVGMHLKRQAMQAYHNQHAFTRHCDCAEAPVAISSRHACAVQHPGLGAMHGGTWLTAGRIMHA